MSYSIPERAPAPWLGLLKFEEVGHRYTFDGQPVDGVTSVIGPYIGQDFSNVDPKVLAEASLLGRRAHKVIEDDCTAGGKLTEGDVDFDMVPYLEGWQEFRYKSGFVPLLSEVKVFSKKYNYAGQLDLFGHIEGRLLLPDIKRVAMVSKSAAIQTAAYEQALRESYPDFAKYPIERCALQIDKQGKCRLHPFQNTSDIRVFLSCLTIHNFKKGSL
jgi:hypothetical protein